MGNKDFITQLSCSLRIFCTKVSTYFEAKIFEYWPLVLPDIQSGSERPETSKFKTEMPKIFDDFKWEDFVDKYDSLRLSKK